MENDNKEIALPGMEQYQKPKKVSNKGKQKIGVTVGTQDLMNPITGEVNSYTHIQKNVSKDFGFHKVWIEDLMHILNSMGNKKITILSHLLKIMRPSDNTMNFTIRSLAEDTGVSNQTVQSTINELIESNVIKRDSRIKQLYTFNPDLLVKGGSDKRQRLVVEYNFEDEQKDIQNSRKNIEEIKNLPKWNELSTNKENYQPQPEFIEIEEVINKEPKNDKI